MGKIENENLVDVHMRHACLATRWISAAMMRKLRTFRCWVGWVPKWCQNKMEEQTQNHTPYLLEVILAFQGCLFLLLVSPSGVQYCICPRKPAG